MKSFRNLFIKSILSLLSIGIFATSCKKEEEKAPELPPQSSFIMDFSDFSNPGDTIGTREMATYQNWGYSYAVVVIWQTYLTVGLAVPVASFLESFNHEAVYHPDEDNWTWSYNVTVAQVVYEAELTGYLEADSVVWEMRVTAGQLYNDFLWYFGKSALDGSGGYWKLQENPLNPNELLKINWHKFDNGTADISYTNIRPADINNGAYIFYGTTLENFNRFYNLFNVQNNNLTEIQWNSLNKDGRVKDAAYFGSENWNCWDTTLMDIVCP
jgi:hypothetical protein